MQDREEQSKLAVERLHQIKQLAVFKAEAEQQVREFQGQIATLADERNTLVLTVADHSQKIETLSTDNSKKQQQLNDYQNKLETLAKERGEHAKHAEDRLQRIKQLETQLAATEMRQTMLNEEMIKAEAQIVLLKDRLFEERTI
jgi:alkaline phosphatase